MFALQLAAPGRADKQGHVRLSRLAHASSPSLFCFYVGRFVSLDSTPAPLFFFFCIIYLSWLLLDHLAFYASAVFVP